ncbi:hypothetical protein CBR_g49314 [Chara braunii]|uniref:non-specific serine/threonine protein kinase n=1 Tax=Chara braunii TaxID=69332 RepID=A0A388M4L5_CHABU|nr:hypothetical protein CBR_g49314 [Chara braunii]|eukprot:GBG89524.1 hypothetical protein CBR_g49314 [Chara braunii]
MWNKYRLGEEQLTKDDLEKIDRYSYVSVGHFLAEYEHASRKVWALSKHDKCFVFLMNFTNAEQRDLIRGTEGRLVWDKIRENLEHEDFDQYLCHTLREARKRRKALDSEKSELEKGSNDPAVGTSDAKKDGTQKSVELVRRNHRWSREKKNESGDLIVSYENIGVDIRKGYLFRTGRGNNALGGGAFNKRIEKWFGEAGVYEGESGHSFRIGGLRAGIEEGWSLGEMMRQGTWNSVGTFMRYGYGMRRGWKRSLEEKGGGGTSSEGFALTMTAGTGRRRGRRKRDVVLVRRPSVITKKRRLVSWCDGSLMHFSLLTVTFAAVIVMMPVTMLLAEGGCTVRDLPPPYRINCGSRREIVDIMDRRWLADPINETDDSSFHSPNSTDSHIGEDGKASSSVYSTVRVFMKKGAYYLKCYPGVRYFLRLRFAAEVAGGANGANCSFSVRVGKVILLSQWCPGKEEEASFTNDDGLNPTAKAIVKEFSILCEDGGAEEFSSASSSSASLASPSPSPSVGDSVGSANMVVTFEPEDSPASTGGGGGAGGATGGGNLAVQPITSGYYAFVNAIELVAIPCDLYGNLTPKRYVMSTLRRWNCGGREVDPKSDNFSRMWEGDPKPPARTRNETTLHSIGLPEGVYAPEAVYQSWRILDKDATSLMYQLIVSSSSSSSSSSRLSGGGSSSAGGGSATYLVRFHFAEIMPGIKAGDRVMNLKVEGILCREGVDILSSSRPNFEAMVVDVFVAMPVGVAEMTVAIDASSGSPVINGLEVLKVGVSDLSDSGHDAFAQDGIVICTTVSGLPPSSGPSTLLLPRAVVSEILLDFAAATNVSEDGQTANDNSNAAVLSAWTNSTSYCDWAGVSCADDRESVIDIDLSAFSRLSGHIPPRVGMLSTLQRLILSGQSFTGEIPSSFANLSALKTLAVEGNSLAGEVPASLLDSVALKEFTWKAAANGREGEAAGGKKGNDLCAPSDARNRWDLPLCGENGFWRGRILIALISGCVGGGVLLLMALVCCCVVVRRRILKREYYLFSPDGSRWPGAGKGPSAILANWLFRALGGACAENESTPTRRGAEGTGGRSSIRPDVSGKLVSRDGYGHRFSMAEVRQYTNDFEEGLLIGKGGFGNVYKGVFVCDWDSGAIGGGGGGGRREMVVAVKRGARRSGQGVKEFLNELSTLSSVRHRHLVSLLGYCDDDGEMVLVYEFMSKGTLRSHILPKSGGGGGEEQSALVGGEERAPLLWRKRLEIAVGAARGLEYLHIGAQKVVIHRDVKSTNILLDDDYVAKVADFGIARCLEDPENTHVSTGVKGSFGYMDPQYCTTRQLTEKSDVYSFGVVLLELVTARPPVASSPVGGFQRRAMGGGGEGGEGGAGAPNGEQDPAGGVTGISAGRMTRGGGGRDHLGGGGGGGGNDAPWTLPPQCGSLVEWALPYLIAGEVERIVDPRLMDSYGTSSLYKVTDVALACVNDNRDRRPSMTDVRRGLEDALMLHDNSLSVVLDSTTEMFDGNV